MSCLLSNGGRIGWWTKDVTDGHTEVSVGDDVEGFTGTPGHSEDGCSR